MRLSSNELFKAVRYALYAGASAVVGFAAPAIAQDAQDQGNQKLETITVTGSNIRRVDIETANPVLTIDRTEIQKTGKVTVGDLLQDLPSMAGGMVNGYTNNGGAFGAAGISLRGLGSARTLVLINGRRFLSGDPNAIPTNAIERIEVLGDGASAVYGSDAIGGVVNFILRSDYQGAEFSADYGISDRDDGERKSYSFTFGHSTDRGSIMGGINYSKQDALPASNRKFSKDALYLYQGHVSQGGSASGVGGLIQLPEAFQDQFNCPSGQFQNFVSYNGTGDPRQPGSYHCFGQSDTFNFQSVGNVLVTPQERSNAFLIGNYKLTDNITAYLEVYHNKTTSQSALAPLPFQAPQDGLNISADNYYNPFGITYGPETGAIYRIRMLALGNRELHGAYVNDQVNTGFKGNFGDSSWSWSLDYGYGHVSIPQQSFGYFNGDKLGDALGPSFYDPGTGTVRCGTVDAPIDDCTPLDIFGLLNDPTAQAVLRTGQANPFASQLNVERIYSANASGELFELPAGALSLAVGATYRKEYQHNEVDFITLADPVTGTCQLSQSACGSPTQGGYNVKEGFAELFIPILKDIPFFHSLNVTLGDRYSKYSNFGNTNNWKVSVEWRPIEDLLLRGTVSKIFRAPTVGNLFNGAAGSAPQVQDPCVGLDAGTLSNAQALGSCIGVPVGMGPPPNSQVTGIVSGASLAGFELTPEFGKSFDFGVVYDPSWLEGLSVTSDIYRIYLNDLIAGGIGSAQQILTSCFYSGQFCQFVNRFQGGLNSGQINTIAEPTFNLGRLDTKGVDFGFNYRLPELPFGNFRVDFQSTYIVQYDVDPAPGSPGDVVDHAAGHYDVLQGGNYTRWRALAGLNWTLGSWDASWRARYVGGFDLGNADPRQNQSADAAIPAVELHYGSQTTHDLQVGYNIEPINTRIDLGVNNVFDKQPPLLYQNNVLNANTDPSTYYSEMVGRFYWGRISVKF